MDLLSNIHAIRPKKSEGESLFTIISRHQVNAKEFLSSESNLSQSFIINYATSFYPLNFNVTSEPLLKELSMKNINYTYEQTHRDNFSQSKKNVLITCEFTKPFALQAINNTDKSELKLNSVVNSIRFSAEKQSIVYIKGVSIVKPKVIKENKLILDFPKTLNSLPVLKKIESPYIKSIRSSQFSYDPLKTRIVIDFVSSIPNFQIQQEPDTFSLHLSLPKIPEKIPSIAKGVSKKPIKKKSRKSSKSKSLKNKVIIIDAGHGGSDPGAVIRKVYEKNLTLDISKRLKNMLEKEGAYVIMTRQNDRSRSLHRRIRIANNNNADMFLVFI